MNQGAEYIQIEATEREKSPENQYYGLEMTPQRTDFQDNVLSRQNQSPNTIVRKIEHLNQVKRDSQNSLVERIESREFGGDEIQLEEQPNHEAKKFQTIEYKTQIPKSQKNLLSMIPAHLSAMKTAIISQIFVDKIQEKSEKYRYKNLKKRDFQIIGDASYFQDIDGQTKKQDTRGYFDQILDMVGMPGYSNEMAPDLKEKEQELFNDIKHKKTKIMEEKHIIDVFDVNSDKLRIWEGYMGFIIPFMIFTLSLESVLYNKRFQIEFGYTWTVILLIGICSFGTHIFIKLNTSYYDCGQLVVDRLSITKNYIRKYLIYDSLSIWAFFESYFMIFSADDGFGYLNLLILLKVSSWNEIMDQMIEMLQIQNFLSGLTIVRLIKLIFMILFVAHIFSLIHIFMKEMEINNGAQLTWVNKIPEAVGDNWMKTYIWVFYWNVTTMTTVGYGDLAPYNSLQAGVQCFVLLFAVGFYSYSFGLVGALIQAINDQEMIFNEQMNMLTKYFREKNVPYAVQASVRQYYAYILRNRPNELDKNNNQEDQVLGVIDNLGPEIKNSINLVTHLQYFNKCPLLQENFSVDFLEGIALQCQPVNYLPGEHIFSEGWNEDQCCIFFLEKGQVELYIQFDQNDDSSRFILKNLNKGDCFGEASFFLEKEKRFQAIAKKPTRVLWLKKSAFMNIIREEYFRADFQTYCELKEKVVFNDSFGLLQVHCYVCNQTNHEFVNCPRIHFSPFKERLIHQIHFDDKQAILPTQLEPKKQELDSKPQEDQIKPQDPKNSKHANQKKKKIPQRNQYRKFHTFLDLKEIVDDLNEIKVQIEIGAIPYDNSKHNFDYLQQEQETDKSLNLHQQHLKRKRTTSHFIKAINHEQQQNNNMQGDRLRVFFQAASLKEKANEEEKKQSNKVSNPLEIKNPEANDNNHPNLLNQNQIQSQNQNQNQNQNENQGGQGIPSKLSSPDLEQIKNLMKDVKMYMEERNKKVAEREMRRLSQNQVKNSTKDLLLMNYTNMPRRLLSFPHSTFDKIEVFEYYKQQFNIDQVELKYNNKIDSQKNPKPLPIK